MTDHAAAVLSGAVEGTVLSEEEREFLLGESVAGLTLFARNIDQSNFDSVLQLTKSIQSCRSDESPPLLISIDQEGGRVSRFKANFPNLGPAMQIAGGKTDQDAIDTLVAYGQSVGVELLKYGVNTNFAPVLDILSNDFNDSIGDRCFGRVAGTVILRAGAFASGLRKSGVLSCAKHFPGQGDGRVDTHLGSAEIGQTLEELERNELYPYRALMHLMPMIMVSHAIYPALDTAEASRSHAIIQNLLRKKMGYTGVVVSDDMTMGAIPNSSGQWERAIIDSILAGVDLILICKGLDKWKSALNAVRIEAKRSSIFERRLAEAAAKVNALRRKIV